jgi:hypothetical protein
MVDGGMADGTNRTEMLRAGRPRHYSDGTAIHPESFRGEVACATNRVWGGTPHICKTAKRSQFLEVFGDVDWLDR